MKVILVIFISVLLFSGSITIKEVRLAFQHAENDMDAALQFNELMKNEFILDPALKQAYFGASETLVAKHKGSISDKIKQFKFGRDEIEAAIKKSPANIEIRLIRLMIQSNAPKILGYTANKKEDRTFIVENFSKASPDLKTYIQNIAKDTDVFSVEEKARLK